MNLGYFMSRGITLFDRSNKPQITGLLDRPFMQIYKQGPFLSKNQISRSYRKNMNGLHTGMQGYYSKFKY